MIHLPPFTMITQRIHLTGAVGATCLAEYQRHVIKSGAKQFVIQGLCKDFAEMLGEPNALLFVDPLRALSFPFKTMNTDFTFAQASKP